MFELCQSGKQRRKNELFRRAEDITTKPVRLYEAGNGTQNSNEPKTDTMIKKELLLGDEAIAWGALNAGLSGVYAYPGTPSTEITEFIQMHPLTRERGIHCNWSANEKTALEAALGMSFVGKRALVCMKHVGMNVCAERFIYYFFTVSYYHTRLFLIGYEDTDFVLSICTPVLFFSARCKYIFIYIACTLH